MRFLTLVFLLGCAGSELPPAPPLPHDTNAAPVEVAQPTIEGPWHGVLAGHLHLSLALTPTGGVLDSLDQGAHLPIDHASFDHGVLTFEIASVGGKYRGTLKGDVLEGTWTQMGVAQPLAFTRGASDYHAEAQKPLDAPIDVVVPEAPAALRADDHTDFVYELHVTNFSHRDVTLQAIDVGSRGKTLLHLEGADLAKACGEPTIGGGKHAVVFLWVPSDAAPTVLEHDLVVRVGKDDMKVSGLRVAVRPGAPVVIAPPLRGRWWKAANGPSNHSAHRRALLPIGGHATIAQRFAIDWVKLGDDDKTFTGDATKNASYHAWGAEALAVAPAVVTETKDGIPENVPGARAVPIGLDTIAGNHVVLDLGGGRFALYAHLQPGSLRVKVGERVRRGQVIGLVGNTGNSSEPHLHFQVTDGRSPLGSEGVPYAFDAFELRGDKRAIPRARQLPVQNEIVGFP